MPTITIKVRNKRAEVQGSPVLVCGNSDYTIAWDLDSEWTSLSNRVARIEFFRNGRMRYAEVEFSGDSCGLPVINGVFEIAVILYAGEIHTDEPARIPCIRTTSQEAIHSKADGNQEDDFESDAESGIGGGGSSGGGGSGGGGGGSETGVYSLYGNLEADSTVSGWTSSDEYIMNDSSSLQSARAWLEANCPAVLPVSVDVGNYSSMGGLALMATFGEDLYVIPDSSTKCVNLLNSQTQTGGVLAVNGTNKFKMHCTANAVIFESRVDSTPKGVVIIAKDLEGNVGGIIMRSEVSAQTDPYPVRILCEGMDSYGDCYLSNILGSMTVISNAPSHMATATVFPSVYFCTNREYLSGELYVDQVKLGGKNFLRVGRNILLTR